MLMTIWVTNVVNDHSASNTPVGPNASKCGQLIVNVDRFRLYFVGTWLLTSYIAMFFFFLKPWPRSPLFAFVLKGKIENAEHTQQMLLNVFNPKTTRARERILDFGALTTLPPHPESLWKAAAPDPSSHPIRTLEVETFLVLFICLLWLLFISISSSRDILLFC